jgi:hypothetical protein
MGPIFELKSQAIQISQKIQLFILSSITVSACCSKNCISLNSLFNNFILLIAGAGFNYEVALSLTESKVIWFSGPWEAGDWNDVKIFRKKGLGYLVRKHHKMVIADNGYRGYPKLCSTPNSYDTEEVALFKSRARCRQEAYNGKLKNFECLSSVFRHSKEQLQACFEAVAVIVQFKMDGGEPLYDI